MKSKMKKYLFAILCCSILFGCNNNDNEPEEVVQNIFEGCCSDLPVFGDNVDMLDQSQGEINIPKIVTVNGDAFNDAFWIENIELYPNHIITIYDPSDTVVFESMEYNGFANFFPQVVDNNYDAIVEGTYKYKIVIENEQTFMKSGTFCLLTGFQPDNVSFSECDPIPVDPVLTGL